MRENNAGELLVIATDLELELLLQRMTVAQQERPPVISAETAQRLDEYLGFRHVVRNVYAFDLDTERVARLIQTYPAIWQQFEQEIQEFITWLKELAANLAR